MIEAEKEVICLIYAGLSFELPRTIFFPRFTPPEKFTFEKINSQLLDRARITFGF